MAAASTLGSKSSAPYSVAPAVSKRTCATSAQTKPLRVVLQCVGSLLSIIATVNALLDPLKTLYGYYIFTDSDNQAAVWTLTVANNFNNATSRQCGFPDDPGNFLDCYYELPVYGTGSLAGATCRSYYPIDKGEKQHVGNYFGNCTFPNGTQVHLPNARFATTQWSVQTTSQDKRCLERIGEGNIFPCDAYTTLNGRVIYHRISRTEGSRWCREFGGFYINDHEEQRQQVLLANVSWGEDFLTFTSIALDVNRPVLNLYDLIGCSAEMHVGGAATHISTWALYGTTTAPWTARTTRTAK
ncbi:TPA: hypothetical protein N0F65_003305, partial [Lagenidium giganteum]